MHCKSHEIYCPTDTVDRYGQTKRVLDSVNLDSSTKSGEIDCRFPLNATGN